MSVDLSGFTRSPAAFLESGHFREAYRYGNYVVKLLKPALRKNYGLFKIDFDAGKYVRGKFGIGDLNEHELKNYERIVREIPEYAENFAQVIEVQPWQGRSAGIAELVKGMDGKIAPRLDRHGKIRDPLFWAHLYAVENALLEKRIMYLDPNPCNIMVKITEAGKIPVFVDHKRIGRQMYPFQFDLLLPGGEERKMRRRFARIRDQFQMR